MKNALVCDSELRAKEARSTICKTYWNRRPRRGPGQRRGGSRSLKTRKLPDLEEEVTSTVPTESGSAPIQGGSISSADVPVNSSVCTSVSVDDMVQTSVGTQPASSGTVGSLCFNESNAKDLEKLTNLVLTSSAFSGIRSRESVQSPVKTC